MAQPQAIGGPDPRRAHARLDVGIDAHFDTLDGRRPVCLINLSQGGAQIVLATPDPLREGVLGWLGLDSFAEVAWQRDEHAGLTFDRLLPLAYMVETRYRAPSIVSELAQAWVSGDLSDR